ESAGADAVIAQGMEAGGHRSAFDVTQAETHLVGLFSLLPGVADALKIPVVATGGIADGRGIAAALLLGASAVQIGTAFLRSPEAKIPSAWADAIGKAAPEDTVLTKAMTGRPARSIATEYVRAAMAPTAPPPAPYPVQRGLTQPMREAAAQANDAARMQAWAGQSARLARAEPAGEVVQRLWQETQALLG
ncbi:MAG: nitronate monooxygenase, partial [Xanthobacteraceae bacterium]